MQNLVRHQGTVIISIQFYEIISTRLFACAVVHKEKTEIFPNYACSTAHLSEKLMRAWIPFSSLVYFCYQGMHNCIVSLVLRYDLVYSKKVPIFLLQLIVFILIFHICSCFCAANSGVVSRGK